MQGRGKINIRPTVLKHNNRHIVHEGQTSVKYSPHIVAISEQVARLKAIKCCIAKNMVQQSSQFVKARKARDVEIARNALAFIKHHHKNVIRSTKTGLQRSESRPDVRNFGRTFEFLTGRSKFLTNQKFEKCDERSENGLPEFLVEAKLIF